jgi:hypothetical protein
LTNLFDNYVIHDLIVAGASQEDVKTLLDVSNNDICARFNKIEPAWNSVRHTGYGEAVRLTAKALYGIMELTKESLAVAQAESPNHQPLDRLDVLKSIANLDHVQIDPNRRPLPIEMAGQDFFHYDINMYDFCSGQLNPTQLENETRQAISNLKNLRNALESIFDRSASYAIAIKSQHAYSRTLAWRDRTDQEAEAALSSLLRSDIDGDQRVCLGDWCIAQIAELSIEYKLPFKMHTGYYATYGVMPVEFIKSGNLCALLRAYDQAKFVLMHIAYPYSDELIALAKHYRNVSIDMCWAWAISPYHSANFVRRFIHTAPLNKLFIFGGDSLLPVASLGYSIQARRCFSSVLHKEVDEGVMSESDAIKCAKFLMMDNPILYFDVERKRQILKNASSLATTKAGVAVFEEPTSSVGVSGKI